MMKAALKIVFSLFLIGTLVSSVGYAEQTLSWSKYPEPFAEDILVSQVGDGKIEGPTLEVNLPQNLTQVVLVMCIQSDTEEAFAAISPTVTIAGEKYKVLVKDNPSFQQVRVPLKDLAAGKTILTFSFGWVGNWKCVQGHTCGYTIHTLCFMTGQPVDPAPVRTPGAVKH